MRHNRAERGGRQRKFQNDEYNKGPENRHLVKPL